MYLVKRYKTFGLKGKTTPPRPVFLKCLRRIVPKSKTTFLSFLISYSIFRLKLKKDLMTCESGTDIENYLNIIIDIYTYTYYLNALLYCAMLT